ncbi:MAG: DUF3990 domain-containing protein [Bacteroidales bacterium]|nr:DUF3990 domain-containing protein [Bacteroidales bacterium]
MMTLYHGSNMRIEEIDLNRCKPFKDFGKGFYLTDILEQAQQMAERRTRIVGEGVPTVTAYSFDSNWLQSSELKVKCFDAPNEEWAKFVLANRRQKNFVHAFDIVVGPVADDGIALQLDRYEHHFISLEVLVKELTYRHLNKQYFFGTDLAVSKLTLL